MGKQWKQSQTLYFWAPKSLQMVIEAMKLKDTPWKESYDQPRQHIQNHRHYFVNKGPSCQAMVFPVVMYGCENWTIKKALHIRWPQYWSFSFKISPTNEHPGLISFTMDWLDLLVVQRTLKTLLRHHSSKGSILRRSAFFVV